MTRETEICLFSLQKIFHPLNSVNLVAVITPDSTQLMDSPTELEKGLLFFMASETGIRAAFCIFILKTDDEPLPLSLGMFLSGAVAGFASLLIRRDLGIKQTFPMGVSFLEGIIEVWVAPLAGLRPHIPFPFDLHLLLAEGTETDEGYRNG
jgi:hypothetical protein